MARWWPVLWLLVIAGLNPDIAPLEGAPILARGLEGRLDPCRSRQSPGRGFKGAKPPPPPEAKRFSAF